MKVLIIPQYSMRSYRTGTYSLLADGNLNIVLHHIFNDTKTNEYTICIPIDHVKEDLEILIKKIVPQFKCSINFMEIPYGYNAEDNRTAVPHFFNKFTFYSYSYVISYFENLQCNIPWILKMHMSKIEELGRPYADRYYGDFIQALKDPMLIRADVLNYAQYNMVNRTNPAEVYKVNVNEQCLNIKLYNILGSLFTKASIVKQLDDVIPKNAIFFPFRISDKAYDFERVKALGRPVVVTDPNESLDDPMVIKLSGNMKEILFSTLWLMQERVDIDIALYEDCELAVHQLIIELCVAVPWAMMDINTLEITERYTF